MKEWHVNIVVRTLDSKIYSCLSQSQRSSPAEESEHILSALMVLLILLSATKIFRGLPVNSDFQQFRWKT